MKKIGIFMSKTDISTTYPRFNRQFFKDLWALAKPFWSSPEKKKVLMDIC